MIDHISPSMLGLFCRCQEAFKRRYLDGDIIPPGIAACIGTGVHRAAEANHRQKISSGVDLSVEELQDTARDAYGKALEKGVFLTEEEKADAQTVLGNGADTAVTITGAYAEKVAPTITPALVEEKLTAEIPGLELPMLGIIDLYDKSNRTKDFKTAGKKWAAGKAESEMQPPIYDWLLRENGFQPEGFDFEVLTHKGDHQHLEVTPHAEDMGPIITRAKALIESTKRGDFLPAEPGHWMCGPKWCGYYYTCPHIPEYRK